MKWVFLAAIILVVPFLTAILRAKPRYLVHACFAAGVLMFAAVPNLWAAPIPWPGWPGPVKGLEVNIIDSIAVALIFSTRPVPIAWSVKLPFAIYVFAILISTFSAFQWMPAI